MVLSRAALAGSLLIGFVALGDGRVEVVDPASVGMSAERLERIGVRMRRFIDDGKIPGTVTLIARRGKVVHFEANGRRDVERDLPMQKDTIFRLYSQTKPVTGAAVMMLFEEGHFLLSDPISKYLPEYSDMRVHVEGLEPSEYPPAATQITIHHLLTHTSGLTYGFFPTPVGQMYEEAGMSRTAGTIQGLAAWSNRLAELPLVAEPGTQWNYSVGMDVLGRLVEVVSGKRFGDFLQERIFDPLEMIDTGFHVPARKIERFAANYSPSPTGGITLTDDPRASPYSRPPDIEMGGGGLVGTVGDYLRFAQMLANKGELGGKRILGRKTVEFMTSDHLTPDLPDEPLTSLFGFLGGGRAWGVGFGITGSVVTNSATSGIPASIGTYSWGGAATTHFWVDHTEELVGMVHTQLVPDGTYPLRELMQILTYQAIVD